MPSAQGRLGFVAQVHPTKTARYRSDFTNPSAARKHNFQRKDFPVCSFGCKRFIMPTKPVEKTLKEWVNHARGYRCLRDFSADSGLSISHISGLETGKLPNPEWSTIQRIAKASEGRCNLPTLTINKA